MPIAEPILRECLAIFQRKQPEDLTTFHAQSLLGGVLLGQEKYAEAEPLLLRGYEGLKAREGQIPPLYARYRVAEAGRRIVRLYEARGRPEKAAEWRAKLAGRSHAGPKPSRAQGAVAQRPAGRVRTGPEVTSPDSWSEKRISRTARAEREFTSSSGM